MTVKYIDASQAEGARVDRRPISRPAVSKHLKLRQASGLASHRAEGTCHVHALQSQALALAALREQIDQL